MSERLLIKLVVGRVLVDTTEFKLPLLVEQGGRGWIISVGGLGNREAEYIGANIDQLNFFHFISDDSDDNTDDSGTEMKLIRKFWLYDLERPLYQYDPATGEAVFEVDSRVAYSNERV
ncbi:hypothetical protein [Paenibacillus herberti]|uniref:Uncharacterized protein n=1 Tax=Paenibacillus herberti TaxID=1619309 RepID=A0A229NTK3_9BACL|nr:hypothetical protein [Paenibacillus herberti]OXM13188.1 hypothetical protein CGZ75_23805 [Paenibacillus herberti]